MKIEKMMVGVELFNNIQGGVSKLLLIFIYGGWWKIKNWYNKFKK